MKPEQQNGQAAQEQLERVLASSGFARNDRLSRFLRFVVERHLAGSDSEIKESLIAVEVFGRSPDYDLKQHSIVRTEAGRLRARLAEYYAGEGSRDQLVIELPKGGYTPAFRQPELVRQERKPRSRRRLLAVALAGLAAVLAATLGWWRVQHNGAPLAIAVLPLENLSHDPSYDYLADGLTDELIRNLSIIEGLAVRSRTSSFAMKGKPRNVREAASQLDADYILEGSVLPGAEELRVNAQLVRARDDSPVWSGRYERALTDVFAIQDQISRGIVNSLRLKLGRGRRRYEISAEAYDLYLRARALQIRLGIRGFARSIGLLEQVIATDPSFAPAYAGLGVSYAIRSIQFAADHPPDELAKMKSVAEKATQLDPLLAEAHEALALLYARDGQWEQSEKSFRRAIELDPNRSTTYANLAIWVLWVIGKNEEALRQMRVAERVDPLSPEVHASLALVLLSTGRYDEAAAHCAKMSADDAMKDKCLARARLGQGRIGDAIPLLANLPTLARDFEARGLLGYAYVRSGHSEEAEKMLVVSDHPNERALIFASLGDKDRTLEALERMSLQGPQRVGMYLNSPELALLRGDPRLKAFRKKVGLPE